MLEEAHAKMLVEARAWAHINVEVQSRMPVEARTQKIA